MAELNRERAGDAGLEASAPAPSLPALPRRLAGALAAGVSLYAFYWVVGVVEPQIYRVSFLLLTLVLTFLLYGSKGESGKARGRLNRADWLLAAGSVAALSWPLVDFAELPYRAATPTVLDVALGSLAIALVLEATRRTVGFLLPATAALFILYAYLGPLLDLVGLGLFGHRGYDLDRLVGTLYMTLEGIFGVPLDVASTYIVLFTIYGAVLERSGAGRFFIDWAMAAMGRTSRGSGPGRTITVAGVLLGMVSGSGVANTVTLGSVGWPLLRRAGYSPEVGGAILSAAGIGAILCPPALGAAAFLIAEFLRISYLKVVAMAIVPALLYYLSAFLMIEADSRRLGTRAVPIEASSWWSLTARRGYHFASLVLMVVLLVRGLSPFLAVFWATLVAAAASFLDRERALRPRRLLEALESGGRGVLSVAATTATAGIIVGVVTLTGLGLKIAGIIVALAQGSLFLTVLYGALAVWILGLAVPVTASYIIAAVMIAPALIQVGISELAAHMFIFYYAVLSEVSPPTALSPFAAAALTGGNPFRTMMLTWKYTLPAFLVPFAFTLNRDGLGLLLQAPPATIAWTALTAAIGVGALAVGFGGWLWRAANLPERILAGAAGVMLLQADLNLNAVALGVFFAAGLLHVVRVRPTVGFY